MGLEARCEASLGLRRSPGRAQLETAELIFRGAFRVQVPLPEIQSLNVNGDRLIVRWPGGTLTLALGAAPATRWAEKIRRPPSRIDKLGVKPTSRAAVVGELDPSFLAELTARAAAVTRGPPGAAVDLIFYAVGVGADLGRVRALARRLEPDGALWIVRPKGRAGADEGVGEAEVRAAGRGAGLVDVKVAAFSATHTADKFVIPLGARRAVKPTTGTARSPRARRSTSAPARTPRRRAPARARGG